MSDKRFVVLGDFERHGSRIGVECRPCHHRSVITAYCITMSTRMSDDMPIDVAATRLKCTSCGDRNARWWATRPASIPR